MGETQRVSVGVTDRVFVSLCSSQVLTCRVQRLLPGVPFPLQSLRCFPLLFWNQVRIWNWREEGLKELLAEKAPQGHLDVCLS